MWRVGRKKREKKQSVKMCARTRVCVYVCVYPCEREGGGDYKEAQNDFLITSLKGLWIMNLSQWMSLGVGAKWERDILFFIFQRTRPRRADALLCSRVWAVACGGGVQRIKSNQEWQIDLDEEKLQAKKKKKHSWKSELTVHQTPPLNIDCSLTARLP